MNNNDNNNKITRTV